MIELALLPFMNRSAMWGRAPVVATRVIDADASTLLELISDPAKQQPVIDGISALLRPRAVLAPTESRRLVFVDVGFGRRQVLRLTWMLSKNPGSVELSAQLQSRSLLARVAMMLAGRRWLQQQLERVLDAFADYASEQRDGEPATSSSPPGCEPARSARVNGGRPRSVSSRARGRARVTHGIRPLGLSRRRASA